MKADFDIAAAAYDDDFTNSSIGKMQRNIVWRYLDELLNNKKELKVLEINCGTGEDAIRFAKKGNLVTATDISTGMLDVARSKSKRNSINYRKVDLNKIESYTFDTEFDLVFSNFGGLNCINSSSISKLGEVLSGILQSNGKFVAVIMPKICLWESLYFTLKGNFKEVFRRRKEYAMANVSGELVKTYYYSPKDFNNLLMKFFQKESQKPVGFFIPPSYLENFFSKRTGLLSVFNLLDKWLAVFQWQASFSDHYYIQYSKR